MSLIESLEEKVKKTRPIIVFPEGNDARVLRASIRLNDKKVIRPILFGNEEEIKALAKKENVEIGDLKILDPETFEKKNEMIDAFVERRKGKVNAEEAGKILKDPNYFGTMYVYMGLADGMVSGACHTTGETVRPALQIIKTKEGIKRTSGAFVLIKDDKMYVMGDCAINTDLDAEGLAEVAVLTEETARKFGLDPRVAMLSFSTHGSAKHERVTMIAEATKLAKGKNPNMLIDGELQFDAAFDKVVAGRKAPDSPLKGESNVFIFPNIEAGNIGYKLIQRFGGYEAIGPILQGLNKPVNDLSRGCVEDEVYSLALVTALESL
ncbi:phosphate acetyltransferase [uncultured Peptoniphilus sp.]|uniref:phosphate acetyltransferase n=1 Tax=uncultured Peptoniphilus sp. TaxID=254354 RepID=UPI0028049CB9|nr:phosphate acetyltransferase [uncultured Peptoniphilus sp.]